MVGFCFMRYNIEMKTKIITRKLGYITPGSAQTARTYANRPIRTSKTVLKSNGKTKTVTYGPINNYGKQKKTKTITRRGLTY